MRVLLGSLARDAVSDTIKDASQAIEANFGGEPDRTFPNDAGDLIMMKDDKKIRFDINNSGNDEPHFHIQKKTPDGEWVDAGPRHRHYFKNGGNE